GPYLGGRRRIADQLDQPVAIDDPAGRHCDIAADHEIFGTGGLLALRRALPILDPNAPSRGPIPSALLSGARKHFGICPEKIRRREHVEDLARRERDHVLVMVRDAADIGGGGVPPLLIEQEGLIDRVERPMLPWLAGKAPVLWQRLDA